MSIQHPKAQSAPVFRSNRDVAIHVPDKAAAEKFYGNVLGFKLIGHGKDHLVLDTGNFHLWISEASTPLSYVPSFSVNDREVARHYLEARGCVAVTGAPTYFRDPFGFVFDVIEHKDAVDENRG